MDAPLHAPLSTRTRRFVPPARTLALIAFGIGIGVVASIPLGGRTALPAVLAVLFATAAVAVVIAMRSNPVAIGVADVVLGIAVIVTVFGQLGLLYVPVMLGFLAVTARIERAAPEPAEASAQLRWEPAPEFEEGVPAAVAAPLVPAEPDAEELVVLFTPGEADAEEPAVPFTHADEESDGPWPAAPLPERVVVHLSGATLESNDHQSGRHRAPSPVRRAAAAAARVGRRLGDHTRAGVGNLRTALVTEPTDVEPPDPAEDAGPDEDADGPPRPPESLVFPDPAFEDIRHRFEERELELVAAGTPWSALTHRAYGELRFLPDADATPPPRPATPVVEIDGLDWEPPTWKTMGDH